MLAWLQQLY
jgi:hypothetical protein